ncbi:sensor histidine kinase [Rhodoblastus acidophilus]|uniref:histidine kinase n=1 Tax=Rhodoblastus acidophilus TaxID=1074 RepID=A0A6N8DGS3_RHOAC|nr:ATP-binding protein [Rhodoblastus acidophilus]MCW2272452.1 signal transduction histidine kinase [Rhodoblastus acidophilus]MTV29369.1 sensor histidine kinase [Rhodoblastus acidophilus]
MRAFSRSIAARLFWSAVIACVFVLTLAGLALTALYRQTAQVALDEQLNIYLSALVSDLVNPREDNNEPGQLGAPQFELALSGWYWQITKVGTMPPEIRTSRSLFASYLPRLPDSVEPDSAGRRRGEIAGPENKPLRMLERQIDAGDQGRYVVQVAATTASVERQVSQFDWALGVTFFTLALLLVAAMAAQARYGLRPLLALRSDVMAVRRGQADRITGEFPTEIAPLAAELNLLIATNREIVERARTQVGNLAHALKTPLSVIVNEAEAETNPLAEKVVEQAQVMRHQVAFYLDRARAAARAGAIGVATPVAPALAAMARAFAKIYARIDLSVDCPQDLRFLGEKQDFDDMLGNLVDNGCKWACGEVRVVVEPPVDAGAERLFLRAIIDDDGPGLAPDRRAEALRRGGRLDESKPGFGLGLSIVKELAEAYGGRLELTDSPLGGLRAVLLLPAAA